MWLDIEFKIGKDKHSGRLNSSGKNIEIELPYFDKWMDCLNKKIEFDNKKMTISNIRNVGDRDEVILIVLNKGAKNEYKHDESRKDS
tara:strand:- start:5201 stop:5461 length:261 start_codon:yes stop_codon:yes gene_type:complete